MTERLSSERRAERRSAGFTLIEIVLVLVLLGILGAAAAYKYFDMQEEAVRTKCAYHRSLVVDELQNRWALAVANSDRRSELFASPEQAASQVLADLNGEACGESVPCQKLCPSGGKYKVKAYENCGSSGTHEFEDGYVFSVTCSEHPGDAVTEPEGCKKSSPSEPEQDPDKVITKDKAKTLMDYLTKIYSDDKGNGKVSSINKFFAVANGDGSAIQSDAKGDYNSSVHDYGTYKSMTEIVLNALTEAGYKTEAIVWRLTSENEKIEGRGDDQHKVAYLTLIVVDRTDAEKYADKQQSVNATQIQVKATFCSRREGDTSEVKSFGDPNEKKPVWVKIKTVTNEGEAYLSIQNSSR